MVYNGPVFFAQRIKFEIETLANITIDNKTNLGPLPVPLSWNIGVPTKKKENGTGTEKDGV